MKIAIVKPDQFTVEYKEGDVKEYEKQLKAVDFDHLFAEDNDGGTDESNSSVAGLAAAIGDLSVSARDGNKCVHMFVSSSSKMLKEAKELNMCTVYVTPKSGRRCDISTSWEIDDISDLKDVVDAENGISFSSEKRFF